MHSPKGRILYTEDDYDCREMVLFTLRQNGYQVTCVDSGTEALSLGEYGSVVFISGNMPMRTEVSPFLIITKLEQFDLFLVDNWLPGLSGPELTRHIREFNQVTPILFYSGAAYEDDKQAALAAGAQAYLIKPIGIERLIGEVERLIHSQSDF